MKENILSIILGIKSKDITYLKNDIRRGKESLIYWLDFKYIMDTNDISRLNYINTVKVGSFLIPEFDWKKWKNFKEKANKIVAIESNFTEGINKEEIKRPRGIRNKAFILQNIECFRKLNQNKMNEMNELEWNLSNAFDLLKIDTSRQSGAIEKIIEMTHSILEIPGKLKCLPNAGKSAYYVNEAGELIKGTTGRKKNSGSKTLDFVFQLSGKKYFIAHKQRDGDGGGQSEAAHEAAKIAKHNCKDVVMCCIFEGKENSNYKDSKLLENENFKVFNSWTSFYKHILKVNDE